tara:strand:- start:838 stop:1026 length:189 start_codon:yes stop_codon:yes gene_type:complete
MRISGICETHGYYKGERCAKCKNTLKKYAPYGFVRTDRGKRTDMEFRTESMEDNMRYYGGRI